MKDVFVDYGYVGFTVSVCMPTAFGSSESQKRRCILAVLYEREDQFGVGGDEVDHRGQTFQWCIHAPLRLALLVHQCTGTGRSGQTWQLYFKLRRMDDAVAALQQLIQRLTRIEAALHNQQTDDTQILTAPR